MTQISSAFSQKSSQIGREYIYLDGLRGLAAIAVVFVHFGSRTDLTFLFAHGYLAVDFFFVLSGFVLSHAYRERLANGKLRLKSLFILRAIRLMPLVLLGTVVAAAIELFRPAVTDQGLHLREIAGALVMGSLLLPVWWTTTLEMVVFPLNPPVWSLFFEVVANGVAVALAKIRRALVPISLLILLSASVLVWVAVTRNNLDVGLLRTTFEFGFARVFFSFFVGVLLYASGIKIHGVPGTVSALGFVAILAVPPLGGVINGLFELFAVLFAFPLIVAHLSGLKPNSRYNRMFSLAGELSYPIYAIHYPIVRAIGVLIRSIGPGILTQVLFVLLGTLVIIGLGWVANKYYDVPLRRYLTRRFASQNRLSTPIGA